MTSTFFPDGVTTLPGVSPRKFYQVTDDPAPLAGMAYPSWGPDWNLVHERGFKHVVCLTEKDPEYDPTPLQVAYAEPLEDLYGGRFPDDADHEEVRVNRAVEMVLSKLRQGEGVVVHCHGGTGRTGTVLGCVLSLLGKDFLEVCDYLEKVVNAARGKSPGWPESQWQEDLVVNCCEPLRLSKASVSEGDWQELIDKWTAEEPADGEPPTRLVLVATQKGQGLGNRDFNYCAEGELVMFPMECDNEECGCLWSMNGTESRKGTTTFEVATRPMTTAQYKVALLESLDKAGWLSGMLLDEVDEWVSEQLKDLERIAKRFPVGTVMERDEGEFRVRSIERSEN